MSIEELKIEEKRLWAEYLGDEWVTIRRKIEAMELRANVLQVIRKEMVQKPDHEEVPKRCDGCGQEVRVKPSLAKHGRLKYGTTEILPCGNLIPMTEAQPEAK